MNVLRISGTQGYPECGTQRVRQFKVDHHVFNKLYSAVCVAMCVCLCVCGDNE